VGGFRGELESKGGNTDSNLNPYDQTLWLYSLSGGRLGDWERVMRRGD